MLSAGYVNCIAGDIGKAVKDDGVEIGYLVAYDNSLRKWWITTTASPADGSAITITSGTGHGTLTTTHPYCTNAEIGSRLIMSAGDLTTFATDLTASANEASRYVDEAVRPFVSVPYSSVPVAIVDITADIAAGIFKRRQMPQDMDAGWWMQGIKKLNTFIESNYLFSDKSFTWNTKDPDKILNALDRKAINVFEARTLLKALTYDPTAKTTAEIAYITKQIDMLTAQIAKMIQDGLLVEAQTTKLAGADTDKTNAETALLASEKEKLDKETANIEEKDASKKSTVWFCGIDEPEEEL